MKSQPLAPGSGVENWCAEVTGSRHVDEDSRETGQCERIEKTRFNSFSM